MLVLVTGASGHLGGHLVERLQQAGHRVRAGVRRRDDVAHTATLRRLGAELADADLARPDTLRDAMDGVDAVCHAAAVYAYCEPQRSEEILHVAVDGAEAALRAAAALRVRKVVLTSSVVTVPLTAPGAPPSTEADWTSDLRVPYIRAKTEAEQRAWRLAEALGLHLVTVLPGAMGGPGWQRPTPSIDILAALAGNAFRMGCPHGNLPYVDVRDVADAHVRALEQDVQGRFIVANDEMPSFERLLEVMHGIDPRIKRPLASLPDFMVPALPLFDWLNAHTLHTPRIAAPDLLASLRGKRWNASSRRAHEVLGWQPRFDLEASLRDTLAEIQARRAAAKAPPARLPEAA